MSVIEEFWKEILKSQYIVVWFGLVSCMYLLVCACLDACACGDQKSSIGLFLYYSLGGGWYWGLNPRSHRLLSKHSATVPPSSPTLLFWGLSLSLKLGDWAKLACQKTQESSCICLPCSGVTGLYHYTHIFYVTARDQIQDLVFTLLGTWVTELLPQLLVWSVF